MLPTVIRRAENCNQLPPGEPFHTVHHTLMRPDNLDQIIRLQKLLHNIGAKLNYIPCALRVPYNVFMYTQFLVSVGRV